MRQFNLKYNVLIGLALGVLLSGSCSQIPSNYRGEYIDAGKGASLNLESGKATFKFNDGRVVESKVRDLKYVGESLHPSEDQALEVNDAFNELMNGQQALYASQNTSSKTKTDLFWVLPNVESRQTQAQFTWFRAEVFFTVLDQDENANSSGQIKLLYCSNGHVMLNTLTRQIQGGCPPGSIYFDMNKVK